MTIVLAGRSEAKAENDLRDMRKAMRKITASKKSARAFLIKHGFITKNNKLTKRYR